MTSPCALAPVMYSRRNWSVPSPTPLKTASEPTIRSVATTSGIPSPLKSATPANMGEFGIMNGRIGWNVPSPFPSIVPIAFDPMFEIVRSGFPSPFRSRITTVCGFISVMDSVRGANVPSPSPRKIETRFELRFATARSSLPSPFRSPIATVCGVSIVLLDIGGETNGGAPGIGPAPASITVMANVRSSRFTPSLAATVAVVEPASVKPGARSAAPSARPVPAAVVLTVR
jgi:hypothetical protein